MGITGQARRRGAAKRSTGPVLWHLVGGIGVCVAVLVAVIVTTTLSTFDRERNRAASSMRAAASAAAASLDEADAGIVAFLQDLAAQPAVASLDEAQCHAAFEGLAALSGQGRLHLLRPNGTEVCGIGDARAPLGDWFAPVQAAGRPSESRVIEDEGTGRLASVTAVPVRGSAWPPGVLVALRYLDGLAVPVPAGAPEGTVIEVVDARSNRLLARSGGADGDLVGTSLVGAPLDRALTGSAVEGPDGVVRLYQEGKATRSGWRVVAGVPEGSVLAGARSEAARTLTLGSIAILALVVLGLVLHRRLALPLRRLAAAVRDGATTATEGGRGPAEVVELTSAFGEMLAQRDAREAELRRRATSDALTGLPNRVALTEHLDRLAEAPADSPRAVLFIDLDRFKLINDSHGHGAGDGVLVEVAERIVAEAGRGCTVGRFGGDEFVVVCDTPRPAHEVEALAARIAVALHRPVRVDGLELYVSASVGIAMAAPGAGAEELLRNADTAMYKAKERGRGGWARFDDEMQAAALARLTLEGDLHRALRGGELFLQYQPKYDLTLGRVAGAEALMRWRHPERGLVEPASFIPVAEECGLIVEMGEWALREAATQAAAWRRAGNSVPVSVNLAARQLVLPELPGLVADVIRTTGISGQDLALEITESSVLVDPDLTTAHLHALRRQGLRISVDDFGTGYSSLSYLQHLPVDEVKIDRSFVSSVDRDASTAAIVGSVVSLAHTIGLRVVAEGVERSEQLTRVTDLGCDEAQGWLLGRPASADAVWDRAFVSP